MQTQKPLLHIQAPQPWTRVLQGISVLLTCTAGQCSPSVNQSDPEDTKILENSGQERKDLKTWEIMLARDIHLLPSVGQ